MTIHYNEKGKFFTNYITKNTVQVTIQTTTELIYGSVYVKPSERIKDSLDENANFIAVTQATICDTHGECLYKTNFIAINRDHIIWLIPDDELIPENELEHEGEEDDA